MISLNIVGEKHFRNSLYTLVTKQNVIFFERQMLRNTIASNGVSMRQGRDEGWMLFLSPSYCE